MDVQGLGAFVFETWTVSSFFGTEWLRAITDSRHRQTICTFIFLEMHRKAYRKLEGLDDASQ